MTFLTILCALLFEQFKPLRAGNRLLGWLGWMAGRIESWCNAGQYRHGRLAWFVAMAALLVPVLLAGWWLGSIHPLLELMWNISIVYLSLEFRWDTRHFRDIQIALVSGEDEAARSVLAEWTQADADGMDATEMTRLTIEKALLTSHRQIFGLLFWLLLLPGVTGAVMYRASAYLTRVWNEPEHMRDEVFGQFAANAFNRIEWLPARVTAATFAIVGNFEDAVYVWRNFANRWKNEAMGIILAAGGGALGVRLGSNLNRETNPVVVEAEFDGTYALDTDVMPGEEPVPGMLQSLVGLIWRTLLLWMFALLLLMIAF